MKKCILLLTFNYIISLYFSFGQTSDLNFQFNFGTNLSIPYKSALYSYLTSQPGEPLTTLKFYNETGFFSEFLVGYSISEHISMNTGLNYNLVRYNINRAYGITEDAGLISNKYFTIPVLINYKISDNFPFYFGIGPYLSYQNSSTEKGISTYHWSRLSSYGNPVISNSDSVFNYSTKNHYETFDFGLLAQIGYDCKLSDKIHLNLFTRLNYGILNEWRNIDPYKWKNYNVEFGVGIKSK